MRPKSQRNFFAGLLFCAVGIAFAWGATTYKVGESSRMGPGYFPLLVGALLTVLGSIAVIKSLVRGPEGGDPIGPWAWRPLSYVIGANVAFGVLLGGLPQLGIPAMGLIAAIYALVFVAVRAAGRRPFKETLFLASVLAIGSYVTFAIGLKLQIQIWPSFIAG